MELNPSSDTTTDGERISALKKGLEADPVQLLLRHLLGCDVQPVATQRQVHDSTSFRRFMQITTHPSTPRLVVDSIVLILISTPYVSSIAARI